MTDITDRRDNPVYERSATEPKYSRIAISSMFEDDKGIWYAYYFESAYYWMGSEIQFVDQSFGYHVWGFGDKPKIGQRDIENIIESAIREELGISLRESVIFESKIEIV